MNTSHRAEEAPGAIVFFDGTCGFCNRAVTFLFERDRLHALRFAPLQGVAAAAYLSPEERLRLDSLVFIQGERRSQRSTAALLALAAVGGPWRLVARVLLLVPRPPRDLIYDLVARHRYRIFGKSATCRLPTPAERAYFLD